ncbi:MAG TPA: hypothetical protein PK986_04870, partial [Spirochaetota bacterium]|nr:hypothetical protein [Spirochaetota bacterium]
MAKVILKSYLKSIHGRVGNLIYYNVHGNQYIRSYSVPYNPRTFKQQKNRRAFMVLYVSFVCGARLCHSITASL